MFFLVNLYGVEYRVKPWNTRTEITYHLYGTEKDVSYLFDLMVDIKGDTSHFSEQDKIYFLYQTLINSTGGDIGFTYACNNCKTVNETAFSIDECIQYNTDGIKTTLNDINYLVRGGDVYIDNKKELILLTEDDLDELDLLDAQKLLSLQKDNEVSVLYKEQCIACKEEHNFDNTDLYKSSLVRSDLQNLYQLAHDFQYFGHINIDNFYLMLPFERDIYLGLIEARREEEKNNQG